MGKISRIAPVLPQSRPQAEAIGLQAGGCRCVALLEAQPLGRAVMEMVVVEESP